MKIRGLIDEDFVNFKLPCMFIQFPYCSFKCNKECGKNVCQNYLLKDSDVLEVSVSQLVDRFVDNPITKAVVLGGLEPFDSFEDIERLIIGFRGKTSAPIVIYTGYTEEECYKWVKGLSIYPNIIIKFGRFIPDQPSHFDEILGVNLASPNQYAKVISNESESK